MHLTFVASGLLMAAMDWIVSQAEKAHAAPGDIHP